MIKRKSSESSLVNQRLDQIFSKKKKICEVLNVKCLNDPKLKVCDNSFRSSQDMEIESSGILHS